MSAFAFFSFRSVSDSFVFEGVQRVYIPLRDMTTRCWRARPSRTAGMLSVKTLFSFQNQMVNVDGVLLLACHMVQRCQSQRAQHVLPMSPFLPVAQ